MLDCSHVDSTLCWSTSGQRYHPRYFVRQTFSSNSSTALLFSELCRVYRFIICIIIIAIIISMIILLLFLLLLVIIIGVIIIIRQELFLDLL